MSLSEVQDTLTHILSTLDGVDRQTFLKFVHEKAEDFRQLGFRTKDEENDGEEVVGKIKMDLRALLPVNGILPSENISFPQHGEHADANDQNSLHVDAFLYNDDEIDDLCDAGQLTRNYCKDCGSKNTAPLNFITHSMSDNQLKFIFRHVLKDLDNRTVLDVGSRLGAVLYGAYFYSRAVRIVGVELTKELCDLQTRIVQQYGLRDRVQVIHGDIYHNVPILKTADVVVMHNVFEFFVPAETQVRIWNRLRETTKSGTVLVLSPSLEESLKHLQVNFAPSDWLHEQNVRSERKHALLTMDCNVDELTSLHFYTVK